MSPLSDDDFPQVLAMQKVTFDLDIYSYQIDFAGHVNNAVYINWMEIGRQKLFAAAGMSISSLLEQGLVPTLTQTNITYKSPLLLSDRVWVELWLTGLGYTSAAILFRFYNAVADPKNLQRQVLVAEGYQRGLFVDPNSHRPKRFSSDQKAALLPYLDVPSLDDVDLRPRNKLRGSLHRSNE
jgi:acyl-CoA thioester hydrolase